MLGFLQTQDSEIDHSIPESLARECQSNTFWDITQFDGVGDKIRRIGVKIDLVDLIPELLLHHFPKHLHKFNKGTHRVPTN